jgi:lipopolysaccharide export system permease protein
MLVLILMTLDVLGESGAILAPPGNGEADLWRYVALRLPQLVALFLPFSVLLGTLVTLAALNQNSEVVIMKAAGLSAHRILAPLMLAALGVAAINFAFNETVLVRAQAEFDVWKRNEYASTVDRPTGRDTWVRAGPDLVQARTVSGTGDATRLSDVTIYDRRANQLMTIVRAATATPIAGGWRLADVATFDVASGRRTAARRLDFATPATPEQFTISAVRAEHTPFWELRPAIAALEAAGKPVNALKTGLNHKLSGPLSAVLMPLLGAVAAFGLARSGRLFLRAVVGLMLGFAYFVADNFAQAMADFGSFPPWAAAWAPFLMFLLIGEAVLVRTEE